MTTRARICLSALLGAGILWMFLPSATGVRGLEADPCAAPVTNPVACENTRAGSPAAEWDIAGAGSPDLQGFATDISVNRGDTVRFKIDTPAAAYRLDIYRLGYYAGAGARKAATVLPHAPLPQIQPPCATDAGTGLVDCGTWSESARWDVPADAVSGVYIAKLVRTDGPAGASHIVFVVRDDTGQSDLLFQTSDTTWQAYNRYGGNSLYVGSPAGRAYKVSYNRPFTTRQYAPEDWLFNAEYPMIRWLEANGYDVSYTTGVDVDRGGAEVGEHDVFLSVGHDEYWSAAQRAAVESARDAGVSLAFFSGNEMFWKTRWEPSIDGTATPHRTLVCYKETHAGAKIDPHPEWTGTWRDPRFSPPADGGNPENALTGTLFTVNDGATTHIDVPAAYGRLRLWRHTSLAALAPGQVASLPPGTLGYEWDEAVVNGHQPAGLVRLSRTVRDVPGRLLDHGSAFGPGVATHSLTLYRVGEALVFGAGTVQWSWGLDAVHDRAASVPDARMQQATANLFADMGVVPATPAAGLVISTPAADTLPPVSAIGAPLPGASVQQGVPITISGTATDAGGLVAGIEVSTDGGLSWNPASGTDSWQYTWTPDRVGPALLLSRAVDDSANVETPAPGVAVTVAPADLAAACPCSLWPDSTVPALTDAGPDIPVELGVKFRSAASGYITALRFYKSPANTGTHVGSLWSATGALLGRVTFASETASGWQTALLDAGVPITAGATYVVSYHTTTGHYAFDSQYFASAARASGPLTALAATTSANGLYRYGAAPSFPNQSYQAGNYWVDVVFATTWADTTIPTAVSTSPAAGTAGVERTADVSVTFSEGLAPESVTPGVLDLRDAAGAIVPGTLSYDDIARRLTLHPSAALPYSTTLTARVGGGTSTPRVTDRAGNPLAADVTWSFTTGAPPPPRPDEGPGGPVLVIGAPANPFTRYYAEILRAEGLNLFDVADLATVDAAMLAAFDVVLLGEVPLTAGDVALLTSWVNAGGQLIAMRPDPQLAPLLGLVRGNGSLDDRYLLLHTASGPGAGLVAQTIQFHGPADLYTPAGAESLATLYSSATAPTSHPAITLRAVGSNGGQAAAFAYDLAKSVVYTRQGNPLWSGTERDGLSPRRSGDLFIGGTEPDYVDLSKVAIPQADEQQRMLANLIVRMAQRRKPLPRFWYFPRGLKAVVIMTGDDHGNGGTQGRFDRYLAASAPGCSVDDWECVRSTSYAYPGTPIASAAAYDALGFEIGVHVSTLCGNYTALSLGNAYASQIASWRANLPGVPSPVTNRTHCIVWSDYDTQPQVALEHGVRLDTNYYYWPASWVAGRPGLFTGSGMPMRFATASGRMIDVYQAPTQMTDESGQAYPETAIALIEQALGPNGYYGAFTANIHTDYGDYPGADEIVAAAAARGVPVIAARQMLTWLDGRNGSSFEDLTWSGSTLTFRIEVGSGARGLRVMLPTASAEGTLLGLAANGVPVTFARETIKGIEYATFAASAASYVATYGSASAPVTTLTSQPAPLVNTGAAAFAFTSNEPGSTFECRLDGTAYVPCASPTTYSGLTEGLHTLEVRATDAEGYVGGPASAAWTIDTTAPAVLARAPAPTSVDVAHGTAITATFSEPPAPSTVTSGTVLIRRSGTTVPLDAGLSLSGSSVTLQPAAPLAPGATYVVTLDGGIADAAGNTLGATVAWSFTTNGDFIDETAGDFGAGTLDAGGRITGTADGEVALAPADGGEFDGGALPAGWSMTPWQTGGTATVSGGTLAVNAARAHPASTYGPGRSLEFQGTFGGDAYQHVGFGLTLNETPWAIFSTYTGGGLWARTHNGSTAVNTPIPGHWLGTAHVFRVDWTATAIVFSIDGVQVASHALAIATAMRPIVSDSTAGPSTVRLNWLRLTPYAGAATFVSRVFDAGGTATWGAVSWISDRPAGTGVTVSVRSGNTPVPDASWTAFSEIPVSGGAAGQAGRYAQYRLVLTTSNPAVSPSIRRVTLSQTQSGS